MGENNRMPAPPAANQMPSVPAHDDEAEAIDAQPSVDPVPAKPRREIEVVATRLGFFGRVRRKAGHKFMIPSLDKAGEWMKCTDPKMELERVRLMKERKKKAVKAGN